MKETNEQIIDRYNSRQALELLYKKNYGMIKRHIKNNSINRFSHSYGWEDMEQEAYFSIVQAVETYHKKGGAIKFGTLFGRLFSRNLKRTIAQTGFNTKVPSAYVEGKECPPALQITNETLTTTVSGCSVFDFLEDSSWDFKSKLLDAMIDQTIERGVK